MNLIKITANIERVKSILKMVELIEERIGSQKIVKFSPLVLSDYYEVIKELMTAILLCDGFKTLSHKDLVDYLRLNYKEINGYEVDKIDKLRVLRNRINYEGFEIDHLYLKDNEQVYRKIIEKIKSLINDKIKRG